jgi:hypothetical protein
MHIDVRPVAKLRGPGQVNILAALGPLFDALSSTAVDLARLRVVCDWIQYRNNFAEPIRCRPVLAERPHGSGGTDPPAAEAVNIVTAGVDATWAVARVLRQSLRPAVVGRPL